jgi:glycosyltransferase involved in cell wall biosynthesis
MTPDQSPARGAVKVLHVITGLNVGGAETMLARLLEQRASTPDLRPQVLTLLAPGPAGRRIAATGVPVHTLSMRNRIPSPGAAVRLTRTVRAIAPDVIMGWMHHGQIAASFAAPFCARRPPVIWNVRHSLDGYAEEKRMSRAVLRLGAWLSRTPAAIVYNSEAASRQYRDFGYRGRTEAVLPNGFDLPVIDRVTARRRLCEQFGIAADALVIAKIARNHPMKNVATLTTAFAAVAARVPQAHLLVVGQGMDRPDAATARVLADLPPGRVTLADHRGDVAEWLAGLDLLALSSAWGEGFPNIVGEAMSAGVPCVVTDVGDAAAIVGDTGRVVPARNAPALAEALVDLATLPPCLRQELGAAARARIAKNFALDRIVARYAALLRAHALAKLPLPTAREPTGSVQATLGTAP